MADRPRRRALLEQALARLQEALAKPEDSIVRDAAIQRFESAFEMAWRAIQAFAQAEGVACSSPRDCFRAAFRLGLIDNDARWMAMVEDRNRTAHTYDEDVARTVFGALPGYVEILSGLVAALREAPGTRGAGA
jgi:nucleotidyltransferase substrate binding protein (TIGR01987 family)